MFGGIMDVVTKPIKSAMNYGQNQITNFGGLLTGNTSPIDYIKNAANNSLGYAKESAFPFGDGGGSGFKGILNQAKSVAMNARSQNQSANAMQNQAQDMRQSLGTMNPFNNYGGFSSMLTGQGNFAPGQNQGSMYGHQPLSRERFGDNTNQSYAPQAWR